MKEQIIEIVRFKLLNSDKDAFLNASERVNTLLLSFPGFIYRSLTENPETKEWLDVAYWTDSKSAKLASESFCNSPEGKAMLEYIDCSSTSMQHNVIHHSQCTQSE